MSQSYIIIHPAVNNYVFKFFLFVWQISLLLIQLVFGVVFCRVLDRLWSYQRPRWWYPRWTSRSRWISTTSPPTHVPRPYDTTRRLSKRHPKSGRAPRPDSPSPSPTTSTRSSPGTSAWLTRQPQKWAQQVAAHLHWAQLSSPRSTLGPSHSPHPGPGPHSGASTSMAAARPGPPRRASSSRLRCHGGAPESAPETPPGPRTRGPRGPRSSNHLRCSLGRSATSVGQRGLGSRSCLSWSFTGGLTMRWFTGQRWGPHWVDSSQSSLLTSEDATCLYLNGSDLKPHKREWKKKWQNEKKERVQIVHIVKIKLKFMTWRYYLLIIV